MFLCHSTLEVWHRELWHDSWKDAVFSLREDSVNETSEAVTTTAVRLNVDLTVTSEGKDAPANESST